ncbi:hypothetical protein D3C72_1127080 [compost metagenome]
MRRRQLAVQRRGNLRTQRRAAVAQGQAEHHAKRHVDAGMLQQVSPAEMVRQRRTPEPERHARRGQCEQRRLASGRPQRGQETKHQKREGAQEQCGDFCSRPMRGIMQAAFIGDERGDPDEPSTAAAHGRSLRRASRGGPCVLDGPGTGVEGRRLARGHHWCRYHV